MTPTANRASLAHSIHFLDFRAVAKPPRNWPDLVRKLVQENGKQVHLHGDNTDSREPVPTSLEYTVVTGDVIQRRADWLFEAYAVHIRRHLERLFSTPLVTANNVRYGLNINCLTGCGARYEWHIDANPLTAVLFCATHQKEDGGQLTIALDGLLVDITPRHERIVVFDGATNRHAVSPLAARGDRLTIPMCYYFKDQAQADLTSLERYLYGDL